MEQSEKTQWTEIARCFDVDCANAMSDLGISPEQAAQRTADVPGINAAMIVEDYGETIGYAVANGDIRAWQVLDILEDN